MFSESGLSARRFLGVLLGSTAAIAATVVIAQAANNPSFGKGAMIGGGGMILLFLVSAAMFVVSLVVTIAALWDIPPIVPGAAVLLAGEVTFAVSLLTRLRRT